ncbi:MAG TPA: lipopolysaccharide biosynthesis protein [Paraburkholderia sp.]
MLSHVSRSSRLRKVWSTYVPYALGIASNAGLNIVLISLLTHRLAPSEYGTYSVAVTVIVLASSIVGQWLQQATGRYLAGSSAIASNYTKAAVLLGAGGITLVLLVLYALVALFLLFDGRHGVGLWLACLFGIAAQTLFTLVGTSLQSEQRAWPYSVQQSCSGGLKIGFSVLVCRASQQNVDGLLYAGATAQLIGIAFGAWRARFFDASVLRKLGSPRTRLILHKLRVYGGAMTLWFIFMNLAMYCDRLLVRALVGPAQAGLYGAASTLVVGSVSLVMAPILAATWPQLMATWNMKNERAASRLLGDLLTYLLCAGVALVAVVNAVAEPATRLFLGAKFSGASTLLPLLTASAFSFSLGPFFHKPLEFKERKVTMCAFAAIVLLVNGLLSAVLTPRLGGIGAGVAALASGALYCLLSTVRGRKIVKWRIRVDRLATVSVLAIAASILSRRVSSSWHFDANLWGFVAASATFFVLFGVAIGGAWVMSSTCRRLKIMGG